MTLKLGIEAPSRSLKMQIPLRTPQRPQPVFNPNRAYTLLFGFTSEHTLCVQRLTRLNMSPKADPSS